MTAVDVDALDKLREAWAAGGWPAVDAMFAVQRALPDLLAEVRRGRALRKAAEGLRQIVVEMEGDERDGIPPHVPLLIEALRGVLADVDAS